MEIISVDTLVREQILSGKDDDAVVRSVQTQVGQLEKRGTQIDWTASRPTNPFWYEGLDRNSKGRKLGKKQTASAMTRYILDSLVTQVRKALELPTVFTDPEGESDEEHELGSTRSSRNVTTKDCQGILYATRPSEVLTHDTRDLFRQLIPILWALGGQVARRWHLDESHRDDLVQEARERIWRNLHKFDGRGWFRAWAAAVARNAMIDYAKREAGQAAADPLLVEIPAEGLDVETLLDLRAALQIAKDSRLLMQRHLLGLTEAELASVEGYNPSSRAISMRLSRAREHMLLLVA
jgi:RNA polymerase sigma factor (sigma-70 family)